MTSNQKKNDLRRWLLKKVKSSSIFQINGQVIHLVLVVYIDPAVPVKDGTLDTWLVPDAVTRVIFNSITTHFTDLEIMVTSVKLESAASRSWTLAACVRDNLSVSWPIAECDNKQLIYSHQISVFWIRTSRGRLLKYHVKCHQLSMCSQRNFDHSAIRDRGFCWTSNCRFMRIFKSYHFHMKYTDNIHLVTWPWHISASCIHPNRKLVNNNHVMTMDWVLDTTNLISHQLFCATFEPHRRREMSYVKPSAVAVGCRLRLWRFSLSWSVPLSWREQCCPWRGLLCRTGRIRMLLLFQVNSKRPSYLSRLRAGGMCD